MNNSHAHKHEPAWCQRASRHHLVSGADGKERERERENLFALNFEGPQRGNTRNRLAAVENRRPGCVSVLDTRVWCQCQSLALSRAKIGSAPANETAVPIADASQQRDAS